MFNTSLSKMLGLLRKVLSANNFSLSNFQNARFVRISGRILLILSFLLSDLGSLSFVAFDIDQSRKTTGSEKSIAALPPPPTRPRPVIERPQPRIGERPEENETAVAEDTSGEPMPLYFVENVGQYDEGVRFLNKQGPLTVFLAEDAIWTTILETDAQTTESVISGSTSTPQALSSQEEASEQEINDNSPTQQLTPEGTGDLPGSEAEDPEGGAPETISRGVNIRYQFVKGQPPQIEGFGRIDTPVSFLVGNDSSKWHNDVPVWSGVRYVDVYPGVNLEIDGSTGVWAWRLVVTDEERFQSGENSPMTTGIRLRVDGANALELQEGDLQVLTDIADLSFPVLSLVRENKGLMRSSAENSSELMGNDLIILPAIEGEQFAPSDVTVTPVETPTPEVEATEIVETETPAAPEETPTPEATLIEPTIAATSQIEIPEEEPSSPSLTTLPTPLSAVNGAKKGLLLLEKSGKKVGPNAHLDLGIPAAQLLMSTYLGGSGEEFGPSVAVDSYQQVYIVMQTASTDFPAQPGLFPHNGDTDAVIMKIITSGKKKKISYLTFFGGSGNDCPYGCDIGVGADGTVYLTGGTTSYDIPLYHEYPSIYPSPSSPGDGNAFVVRLRYDGKALMYSTYLGGAFYDKAYSLALGPNNTVYVTGHTFGGGFPVTPNAYHTSPYGGQDIFVAKLNTNESGIDSLVYSTLLGGAGYEQGHDIAVRDNQVYITGQTNSSNLPISDDAFQRNLGGEYDAFLAQLSADGSDLLYMSYFGGGQNECELNGDTTHCGIALGPSGDIFLDGITQSYADSFPLLNPHIGQLLGGQDVYVARFDPDMNLEYSTYLGGSGGENTVSDSIRVDANNVAYVTGSTTSSDFPVTENAYDKTIAGEDLFLTKVAADGSGFLYSTVFGGTGAEDLSRIAMGPKLQNDYIYIVGVTTSSNLPLIYPIDDEFSGPGGGNDGYLIKFNLVEYNYNTVVPDRSLFFDCEFTGCHSTVPGTQGMINGAQASGSEDPSFDRINTRKGEEYHLPEPDLAVSTVAGELEFRRLYNSGVSATISSDIGYGWTHNHDVHLIFSDDPGGETGAILFKSQSTNIYRFLDNGDGTYSPEPGVLRNLSRHEGPPVTYTMTDSSQRIYTFDETGKLFTIADAQGFTWQYQYDVDGRIQQVTDVVTQYHLEFGYNAQGQLIRVQDHTSRGISLGYDTAGDLTTVTDVLGQQWQYTYDSSHHLVSVRNPSNVMISHTEYDSEGRAYQQYGPNGSKTLELGYQTGRTEILSANNSVQVHLYNTERNTLVDEISAADAHSKLEYDNNFRPITVQDENGNKRYLVWSEDGNNLAFSVDALGNQVGLLYDEFNNLSQSINERGYLTSYVYGAEDVDPIKHTLLLETMDAYGQRTSYTYTTAVDAPQPSGLLKTVTDPLGHVTTYTYNALGQMISVQDDLEHVTAYAYDAVGRLQTTVLPSGVANWTCYDAAGRIVRTVDNASGDGSVPAGNPCDAENYQPDTTSNRDQISTTVFDASGNAIAAADKNGRVVRTYYDEYNRPAIVVQNWVGGNLINDPAPSYDPNFPDQNIRTETRYDSAGRVIATIDRNGIITRTYYDVNNRPYLVVQNLQGQSIEEETPPDYFPDTQDRNLISRYYYDAAGNMIATQGSDGRITRTYFDQNNRPIYVFYNWKGEDIYSNTIPSTTKSDENFYIETVYDQSGNVIKTNEAGFVRRTYYDALNRPETVIDNYVEPTIYDPTKPDQNLRTDYVYDAAGNRIVVIDPNNIVTRTYYDGLNRPTTIINNWVGIDDSSFQMPTYDPLKPDENVRTDITYDAKGRAIAVQRWKNATEFVITRKYFDNEGRVVDTVDNWIGPDISSEVIPSYDSAYPDRNLRSHTDYDAAGRVIATKDNSGKMNRTYYDGLGRVVLVVSNFTGNLADTTPPAYDPLYPDRNVFVKTEYLAMGSVRTTDAAGKRIQTCQNAIGQVVKTIVNPSVPNPCDAYTASGLPDQDVISFSYYDASGNLLGTSRGPFLTQYSEYDGLSRKIADEINGFTTMRYEYDKTGHLSQKTDAEDRTTHYSYDRIGRLVALKENTFFQDNTETRYTYDAGGNLISIRDANSVQNDTQDFTTFTYNGLGQMVRQMDPLGNTWEQEYDAFGNRIQTKDALGKVTKYEYDGVGRLTKIDYEDPGADVTFTYDAAGRRITMSDGAGTTQWSYDDLGRVKTVTDPSNRQVMYEYDGSGQRTKLVYPDSKTVSYSYNQLGQLQTVTDWQNKQTQYTYTPDGQLQSVHLPNGIVTLYTYDSWGRIITLVHSLNGGELARYQYEYDRVGNRTKATEWIALLESQGLTQPQGLTAQQRGFMAIALTWDDKAKTESGYRLERSTDGQNWENRVELGPNTSRYVDEGLNRTTTYWYRLTAWNMAGATDPLVLRTETSFDPVTNDANGGTVTQNDDVAVTNTISYSYDAQGRLTVVDYQDGGDFSYTYDAMGNRLTETSSLGTINYEYDSANRLTSVGGVSYQWDANGNLLSDGSRLYGYDEAGRLKEIKSSGGNTISTFTYNGLNNRVAQTTNGVVTEYVLDQEGSLAQVLQDGSRSYVYGGGRIAQKTATTDEYFLGDTLESVRQMADSTGAVVLERNYKPFGEELSRSGSGNSPYGFTGEWQGDDLIYLRARYYAPGMGRFISRDTWGGDVNNPITYNKWLYANANPVNLTDPSGYCADLGGDGNCDPRDPLSQCYQLSDPIQMLECFKNAGCDLKNRLIPQKPIGMSSRADEAYYTYLALWKVPGWWNGGEPYVLTPLKFLGHLLTFEFNNFNGIGSNTYEEVAVGNYYYRCDLALNGWSDVGMIPGLCPPVTDRNVYEYIAERGILHYGAKNYAIKYSENINASFSDFKKWKNKASNQMREGKNVQFERAFKTSHSNGLSVKWWSHQDYRLDQAMEWGNRSMFYRPGLPNVNTVIAKGLRGRRTNEAIGYMRGDDPGFIFTYCQYVFFSTGKYPVGGYCQEHMNDAGPK